jgi:predicted ATPase
LRLLRLEIVGSYKGLSDQSFDFSGSSDGILTFVGPNGSGKSQLLELIAEVFGYLERLKRSDFRVRKPLPFEIAMEYEIWASIDPEDLQTYWVSTDLAGGVDCQYLLNDEWLPCELDEIDLPQHIVGYASGLNENLQRSFLKNAVQYFDVMLVRAARRKRLAGQLDEMQVSEAELTYLRRYPGIFKLDLAGGFDEEAWDEGPMDGVLPSLSEKDTTIPSSIFLDYDCNALLMASLAILPRVQLDILFPDISYKFPEYICIQYDFRKVPVEEDAIRDIQQLVRVVGSDHVEGISDITSDALYDLYDLDHLAGVIHIDLAREGLREQLSERYYDSPIIFFEKLYKIQLLGVAFWHAADKKNLRRDDYFETVKKPLKGKLPLTITRFSLSDGSDVIDFDDLSDGEAQLIQVLGAARIFGRDNTLFIFDEPETHLNPSWRTRFHKRLTSALGQEGGVNTAQVLLSTHSPFLVSSLKRENVYRFERSDNTVAMSPVERETYGASFDVLIKDFFGLSSLISQTAVDDIKQRLHDNSLSNEQRREWLEDNVGDSMEKAYLLRKLQD